MNTESRLFKQRHVDWGACRSGGLHLALRVPPSVISNDDTSKPTARERSPRDRFGAYHLP